MHDSQVFEELLDHEVDEETGKKRAVSAYSAYRSEEKEAMLIAVSKAESLRRDQEIILSPQNKKPQIQKSLESDQELNISLEPKLIWEVTSFEQSEF